MRVPFKSLSSRTHVPDWKSNVYGFAVYSYPWVNGRECAGKVISIGSKVRNDRLKVGDRVFVASSNYRDIRTSCFQERCVALPENCGRIPDHLSYEAAAGLGVALVAAAAALYESLEIPRQPELGVISGKKSWILIWASASSAGIVTAQLAKLAGLCVIGVSSKSNFEYTKEHGVDITLDRADPEEVVRTATKLGIDFAVDCVGAETAAYAARCLSPGGALVALVKPPKEEYPEIRITDILIKKFHEDRHWGDNLMRFTEFLLAEKKLNPPRLRHVESGIAGIPEGLKLLENNQISGEKVVVKVSETPATSKISKRAVPSSRPTTPVSRPGTPSRMDAGTKRRRIVV